MVNAFVSFNSEDAEHFTSERYAQNTAQEQAADHISQQAPEHAPERHTEQHAQQAPEHAPEENRGWVVENNFGQNESADDSSMDSDDNEVVEFPTWNLRITVSADEIQIRRAR